MDICAIPAADKQLLAKKVGNDLARNNGKKRFYSVDEVKAAARRQRIPDIWDCWALSMYSSPLDFNAYHAETGEICDYSFMHSAMVEAIASDMTMPDGVHHAITSATEVSWFSEFLDFLSSIELPDFDFFDSSP